MDFIGSLRGLTQKGEPTNVGTGSPWPIGLGCIENNFPNSVGPGPFQHMSVE